MSELKVIKNYLTRSDCYNSGRRINPIGIQIHTIGTAQNTAASLASYWNQPGLSVGVHYCVDAEVEGKVLQFMPENYRSWADAGFGNNSLITIEGMESDYMRYTGGASFTITNTAKFRADIKRSYNGLVLLCTKICRDRGWNPLKRLSNGLYLISSHNEGRIKGLSSGHVDPDHVWSKLGYTMDGFRQEVAHALEGSNLFVVGKEYQPIQNMTVYTDPYKLTNLKYKDIPTKYRKYYKNMKSGNAMYIKSYKIKCLGTVQKGKQTFVKFRRGYVIGKGNKQYLK